LRLSSPTPRRNGRANRERQRGVVTIRRLTLAIAAIVACSSAAFAADVFGK
jgi:hypothetical protein